VLRKLGEAHYAACHFPASTPAPALAAVAAEKQ